MTVSPTRPEEGDASSPLQSREASSPLQSREASSPLEHREASSSLQTRDTRSARDDAEGSSKERPRKRATRSSRSTQGGSPRPSSAPGTAGDAAAEPEALPTFEVVATAEPPVERAIPRPSNAKQPRRYPSPIDVSKIDADVLKVVKRLVRAGYEAYLVGGCVRDLLLLHRPKDFDVATSARPEEVRRLFRNSRVIGRRFRLVHVLFGAGKVIEVATFRRNPRDEVLSNGAEPVSPEDVDDINGLGRELLIRTDNSFGEAHEDAERRDFTINALLYDTESNEILDFVGGMTDIERRVVNTIGDPEVRFLEDPVRILRALKFAGKLGLGIHPSVYDAIVRCRESLTSAARPRVSEEILRLLRGGAARRTIFLAWETGVLDVLLPELSSLLADALSSDDEDGSAGARAFRLLRFVDDEIAASGPLDDAVLWTMLLLEPLKEACEGTRDRASAVADFLEPLVERLGIPRRFADTMRRVLGVLPRLESGRAGRFARTELFEIALVVARGDLIAQRASLAPLKGFQLAPPAAPRNDRPNDGGPSRPRTPRR
ncbi:MAG: polynucleotide adenylyltransferase PcnB [Polyangiaceae bacterium]